MPSTSVLPVSLLGTVINAPSAILRHMKRELFMPLTSGQGLVNSLISLKNLHLTLPTHLHVPFVKFFPLRLIIATLLVSECVSVFLKYLFPSSFLCNFVCIISRFLSHICVLLLCECFLYHVTFFTRATPCISNTVRYTL